MKSPLGFCLGAVGAVATGLLIAGTSSVHGSATHLDVDGGVIQVTSIEAPRPEQPSRTSNSLPDNSHPQAAEESVADSQSKTSTPIGSGRRTAGSTKQSASTTDSEQDTSSATDVATTTRSATTKPVATDEIPDECLDTNFDNVLYVSAGEGPVTGTAQREVIIGTDGADVIVGGQGDDCIIGNDGNDTISGGADKDILLGGDGADEITAENGEDIAVYGGSGDDLIHAGAGPSTVDAADGTDVCDGARTADKFVGCEQIER